MSSQVDVQTHRYIPVQETDTYATLRLNVESNPKTDADAYLHWHIPNHNMLLADIFTSGFDTAELRMQLAASSPTVQ